jgi:hypothetical protein
MVPGSGFGSGFRVQVRHHDLTTDHLNLELDLNGALNWTLKTNIDMNIETEPGTGTEP